MLSMLLAAVVTQATAAGFSWREALPGYSYQFPRDHFEHEEFRTEWWYYTGNVSGTHGERYGFELVFFRMGDRRDTQNPSAWAVNNLYLAHAALTDVHGKQFRFEERVNRAGPGVAGASFEKQKVWNGNWSVTWVGEQQTLDALTDQFRFHLDLRPQKPFVIQGENGLSQKSAGKGRASYYVSFPLLAVTGQINGAAVSGQAWMDHEWFTEQLASDQVGWDWFSVQLDDHTELMLFELRRKDGTIDPYSSGTFVDANGKATHLRHEDFSLEPLTRWKKYPVEWRIKVPARNIDVTCKAVMQNQELRSKQGGTTYWEGAVDYRGTQSGVGYLEMTGYDGAVKF
jgi:predicted secreted hydrolase